MPVPASPRSVKSPVSLTRTRRLSAPRRALSCWLQAKTLPPGSADVQETAQTGVSNVPRTRGVTGAVGATESRVSPWTGTSAPVRPGQHPAPPLAAPPPTTARAVPSSARPAPHVRPPGHPPQGAVAARKTPGRAPACHPARGGRGLSGAISAPGQLQHAEGLLRSGRDTHLSRLRLPNPCKDGWPRAPLGGPPPAGRGSVPRRRPWGGSLSVLVTASGWSSKPSQWPCSLLSPAEHTETPRRSARSPHAQT